MASKPVAKHEDVEIDVLAVDLRRRRGDRSIGLLLEVDEPDVGRG